MSPGLPGVLSDVQRKETDMSEDPARDVRDEVGSFTARPDIETMRILKRARLKAILEFARNEHFVSQKALGDWLYERNLGCNQGQLSKDLDQLGLAVYIDRAGNKRLGRRTSIISDQLEERYVKIFQEAVRGAEIFGCFVIVSVVPGCSQAVATVIEAAGWVEVKSISCGTDSVTVMCADEPSADLIFDRLREGFL